VLLTLPQTSLFDADKHLLCYRAGSAESGIRRFATLTADGKTPGRGVASPEGLARNPAFVLEFYNQRRAQARTVQPNAAHRALAGFEEVPGWRVSTSPERG
jgi:NAD-dependent deacetylase